MNRVVIGSGAQRVCAHCNKPKPDTEYHSDSRRKDGLQAVCKVCKNAETRADRTVNPDKYRTRDRKRYPKRKAEAIARNRLKRSGWTQDMFDTAWETQKGLCAICQRPMLREVIGKNAPCADHCHRTNIPRALLHKGCNSAIGYFQDDPILLRAAADYIERYETIPHKDHNVQRTG